VLSSYRGGEGAFAPVYRLRVTLEGIEPPIWRLLELPGTLTLLDLHRVLQSAMGWEDRHLFRFEADGARYGPAHDDALPGVESAEDVRLTALARRKGARIRYSYDFGDSWKHEIVVERITRAGAEALRPRILGGARACPPEDCGGVPAYHEILDALADPRHEEHHAWGGWVGWDFDPDHWDQLGAQRDLDQLMRDGPASRSPSPSLEDLLHGLFQTMAEGLDTDPELPDALLGPAMALLTRHAERSPEALLQSRKPRIWAAAALHAASLSLFGRGNLTVGQLAHVWGLAPASVAARSLELREDGGV